MSDESISSLASQAQRLYYNHDFAGAIDCLNTINGQLVKH